MRAPSLRGVAVVLLAAALAGCGGKKNEAGPATLSADAAFKRGMELLQERELRKAIASFQAIQYTPDTLEDLEPLSRLAMADATFYQGTDIALIDARNLYLDFVTYVDRIDKEVRNGYLDFYLIT